MQGESVYKNDFKNKYIFKKLAWVQFTMAYTVCQLDFNRVDF